MSLHTNVNALAAWGTASRPSRITTFLLSLNENATQIVYKENI